MPARKSAEQNEISVEESKASALSAAFSSQGYVRIPVYQNVHGIQQTARFKPKLGLSANVDLLK
jgi:hypothetical protein